MMVRSRRSLDRRYFDHLYSGDIDPWRFATSDYETAKYDATLLALPRAKYDRALEVGCSVGVLTARLASRCRSLLATDISAAPLAAARERCAAYSNVTLKQMRFPLQPAAGAFDLVVLSEVLYYLSDRDVEQAAHFLVRRTALHADALLVHWTGRTNYPQTAERAVAILTAATAQWFTATARLRTASYALMLLRKRDRR